MYKKKNTSNYVKQVNIRLNTKKIQDLILYEDLCKELEKAYASKNECLKRILYRGLTGGNTFYSDYRDFEEIADKAVDKDELEQQLDEIKDDIREMVRQEIRKAIKE